MGGIAAWLEEIGLGQYAELFETNDVTVPVLPELTDDDLKQLGISLGHRRMLLKRIRDLESSPEEAGVTEPPSSPVGAPMPARPHGERRQLTVMFVDLVGSTALARRLDPEDLQVVITGYQSACSEVIGRYEGHVANFMGDGVLAYFGYPRAHEDDAERAVRAGLAVTEAVSRLEAPLDTWLTARVGIATGLVVVGDLIGEGAAQEEAVVDETPNLAARLQGIAAPGQVVIADATRRLVGESFELENLGELELKGMGAPVQALAVTGERPVESRFEAMSGPSVLPMVGRDQELALLLERWAQAKAGEGQGVLLVGEAGIGKSRIVRALLDAVAEEPHSQIRYQCSPYHVDSALWPVIQQLTQAAGLGAEGPVDARLDKLEALLHLANGRDAAPLLADLLGLDGRARYGSLDLKPKVLRTRTLDALVGQMLGLAARQPVLMVLEDAHWIDPTTLELIEQCLDRIAAARVLMLLNSRPDRQPDLAAHPHVTRLTFNRLGRAGVEAIVAELVGDQSLPPEVTEAIVTRTDGVPVFVEELTKAILETGKTSIPASLHDSLMARLDRVPDLKETAQIAACIGREFTHELLAAVADKAEPELCVALDKLTAAGIVFRRGAPPDARYTFKHALLRDAAYQSLLKSRRQQLHERIVRAMEESTDGAAHDVFALHAQHAGLWRKAVDGYTRAARQAADRWAMREATSVFQRALQSLESVPDDQRTPEEEIDLRLELNNVMWRASHLDGMAENLAMAEASARRIGDQRRLASTLTAASRHFMATAQPEQALRVSEQILEVGQAIQDPLLTAMANCRIGLSHHFLDQNRQAIRPLRECLSFLDGQLRFERFGQPGALSIVAGSHLVYAYAWLGHFEAALREGQYALDTAKRIGHPYEISFAASAFGFALRYRGDYEKAAAISRLGIETCERSDVTAWISRLYANLAVARAHSGELAAAAAVAELVAPEKPIDEAFFACAMAEVFLRSADESAAVAWSEKAFALSSEARQRALQVQAKRLRVAARLRNGTLSVDDAHAALLEAITTSEELELRAEAMRSRLDLARLWRDQGERQKARDLLAPVYGWFAEGYDMANLQDAKALLDELA